MSKKTIINPEQQLQEFNKLIEQNYSIKHEGKIEHPVVFEVEKEEHLQKLISYYKLKDAKHYSIELKVKSHLEHKGYIVSTGEKKENHKNTINIRVKITKKNLEILKKFYDKKVKLYIVCVIIINKKGYVDTTTPFRIFDSRFNILQKRKWELHAKEWYERKIRKV